ncbi:MAG: T9SS type A sorting domain-containing protein, partial [Bacteroidales bacterium]|nr:T9SS type A sorting domain-containing protein [Bacteroidales bacterium]
ANTASIIVTPTASSTYSVTGTDANGCSYSATVSVTVNPLPTPTISQANNYTELTCSRTSITLTANGSGGTFAWSGGGTDNTKEVSEAGTYTVTETKNGCHGTSEGYEITSNDDVPTASISGNNEICLGGSTTLETTSNANYTYSWSNSVTTYTNTVAPTTTTEYKVTTTDTRNDCSATAARTVTVITPNIDASSYDYIWRGVSTDWNTASNWYVYNSGYSVATELPTTAKNIYIGTGICLATSNWPSQTGEANANNITIASGASLNIPASKTLNIAGSITNNGTFTASNSSTIVFKGSATQTLNSAMTFGNVTFAQTALDTIKAPNGITVNGTATFNKGIVMGEMTFNAGATAANVTDSASFVAGKVTKLTGASAEPNFTFPTGSAGDGQPKVLGSIKVASLPANSETFVVFNQKSNGGGFSESEMPRWWNQNNNCEGNNPLFDHISNFEFWNVSTNSILTADLTVSANNRNAHFSPDAVSYDGEDIFGAMWQGGCWKKVSDHAVVSDPKTITISGVTIPAVSTRATEPQWLSMGSKNHETLLPIELVSFTADCDGHSALVEWTTATERNNDYFSLERSDDAINFTEIARVAGAGNSIEPLEYAYNDYGIHGGDNYYRLVQVDYDGTRTASEIIVANCIEPEIGEPDVQTYPNPFNGELTVELDNFGNRPATIEVYDMLGKLIYTDKVAAPQNFYETILNLSNLPPAAYTVRVSTNDFVINKNVIKQ